MEGREEIKSERDGRGATREPRRTRGGAEKSATRRATETQSDARGNDDAADGCCETARLEGRREKTNLRGT